MLNTPQSLKTTTPSGIELEISPLTAADVSELDNWLRGMYLERAAEAVKYLPLAQQNSFLQSALDTATKLTSRFGDGRQILFSNVYGIARLTYQAIRSPKMTFTEYHTLLFPDDFLTDEGINFVVQFFKQLEGDLSPSLTTLTNMFVNDLTTILKQDTTDQDTRDKIVNVTLQFYRMVTKAPPANG